MNEIAKHCIALRNPKGKRLQLMPGQALPDWVGDDTRAQLRAMGALEPYWAAPAEWGVKDPEAGAEALRAAAEAVTAPGGSVDELLGADAEPAAVEPAVVEPAVVEPAAAAMPAVPKRAAKGTAPRSAQP